MKKLDLKKKYTSYYNASKEPEVVDLKAASFLSITGKGDPSSAGFTIAIQALYATAYKLKFMHKTNGQDFVVPSLEALWWFDMDKYSGLSMTTAPEVVPRSEWEYQLLIRMPEFVQDEEVSLAREQAFRKKKLAEIEQVRFEQLHEGLCVQLLHVGPFSEEGESLKKLEAFMKANRLEHNGHHHEVYLSNFNRTPPAQLRTILREPVRKIEESL
jgi:hypothetical protein